MGLFTRKVRRVAGQGPATDADAGTTEASKAFVAAVRRGDLDEAGRTLDDRLRLGGQVDVPPSLLDRAAAVRSALQNGLLDDAAAILSGWESPYSGDFDQEHRAKMNTLGLLLIGYFQHPDAGRHPSFDALMDGALRDLGKETGRRGDPFFGDLYASVKSGRALGTR